MVAELLAQLLSDIYMEVESMVAATYRCVCGMRVLQGFPESPVPVRIRAVPREFSKHSAHPPSGLVLPPGVS
jgi:hypothetical protein